LSVELLNKQFARVCKQINGAASEHHQLNVMMKFLNFSH